MSLAYRNGDAINKYQSQIATHRKLIRLQNEIRKYRLRVPPDRQDLKDDPQVRHTDIDIPDNAMDTEFTGGPRDLKKRLIAFEKRRAKAWKKSDELTLAILHLADEVEPIVVTKASEEELKEHPRRRRMNDVVAACSCCSCRLHCRRHHSFELNPPLPRPADGCLFVTV